MIFIDGDFMGLISSIRFNNDESMSVEDNEIIVFVGPNNAGKSQSLKDIFALTQKAENPTTVIRSIGLNKPSLESFESQIRNFCQVINNGDHEDFHSYNFSYNTYKLNLYTSYNALDEARNLLVSYLSTEDRLTLANPPESINRDSAKTHPIHYPAFEKKYRTELSEFFERAFGKKLIPNILFGRTIPLCIGDSANLKESFSDEQTRLEAYAEILQSYDQVQDQGDGIRSFVGIILNLMLESYQLFLLDEPESFLHPPQAKIIGEVIGQMASNRKQVFISTHSRDVVQGLVETCPNRVKIVRITRRENTNFFSILENETVSNIWKDPLLRYSAIMDSMFHQSVVLCESDSDCKMYSIIFAHYKEQQNSFLQTQFIHCGGKHRMHDVAKTLSDLGMTYRIVLDFDVLNNESILSRIVEACEGKWENVRDDYHIINTQVNNGRMQDVSRKKLEQLIAKKNTEFLQQSEIDLLRDALKSKNPWENAKQMGELALPRGNASEAYQKLSKYLKSLGIFIVPSGELESFVPEVGGHGPKWVNSVLEQYPDLSNDVYKNILDFIKTWEL